MQSDSEKQRKQILVLEDSGLIAMEIEQALRDRDLDPICVASVAEALDIAASRRIDCALLNFHLADGLCTPVALLLLARDCPVAIVSGSNPGQIDEPLRDLRFFRKPVAATQLVAWVQNALGGASGTRSP